MVRVVVPSFLRTLAGVPAEAELEVAPPVTQRAVLDALEARYPALCGTIRDHVTKKRRPLVRFYACSEDVSNEPPDSRLPDDVARGKEPLLIVASIAGG
jgi:molybdopterin synthase sulfur carrier subunit